MVTDEKLALILLIFVKKTISRFVAGQYPFVAGRSRFLASKSGFVAGQSRFFAWWS